MIANFRWHYVFLLAALLIFITSCESDEMIEPEPDTQGNNNPPADTLDPGIWIDSAAIYTVFEMNINVENNAPIVSKETADYLNCSVSINGKSIEDNYEGTARIRGRGNSTWFWYDKKPYRIKLDETSEILGLKRNKDWVLLANYRDPTNLMNAFGFSLAKYLDLPFTNNSRYIEVTLNGDYIGLYQLTEQVEQGGNRVDIDEVDGLLICLDKDDGPSHSPDEDNNFWSKVFNMPISVKYPKDPTPDQIDFIQKDFEELEKAIDDYDYESVAKLIDIPSFIDYMIIQELTYNVEVDAPRSVFMHKDKGGKYVMGPVWDFDAGFDFDWSTMQTGHNYFNEQELVFGSDPAYHENGYWVPEFFTQMFLNKQFVDEFKNRWNDVKDDILHVTWESMEKYETALQDAMVRDFERWPIDKDFETEIERMKDWLSDRVSYLTTIVNDYP